MRDAHKRISSRVSAEPRSDGFVYLTIIIGAALVAAFSLHGAPELLGGPLSPETLLGLAH